MNAPRDSAFNYVEFLFSGALQPENESQTCARTAFIQFLSAATGSYTGAGSFTIVTRTYYIVFRYSRKSVCKSRTTGRAVPSSRPKDGTARFRPAERKAELQLMKKHGTAFECLARKVSIDVRCRNCRRKMEIVEVRCADQYSKVWIDLPDHRKDLAESPAVLHFPVIFPVILSQVDWERD